MDHYSFLGAANSAFFDEMYNKFLNSPDSIESSWRNFFQGYRFAGEIYTKNDFEKLLPDSFKKEFSVLNLIDAYRNRGHLFTQTNPVRKRRNYSPKLDISNFNLGDEDLETTFQAGTQCGLGPSSLRKIITHLNLVYCQSIGIEFMYIRDISERNWIMDYLHRNDNQPNFNLSEKKQILKKLNEAVAFENFLHTKYVGQKRFSIEGAEVLIPALDTLIEFGANNKISEFVFGMAHRGRLSVLVNIFKKPYRNVFQEFEGVTFDDNEFDGDVKYHLGYSNTLISDSGKEVTLSLVPNPSHLEAVSPVMLGISKAKINKKFKNDYNKLLPIIIHGDAALSAQGVVYEVIQMSQLNAYKTGGTIHIVINNQVGFTTNYLDGRTSTYCTDVAKTTLSPVLHVNSDDVEAVVHSVKFALLYRQKYNKDIFIDLLCYRRYGHNEGDEPRFTQPKLYETIAKHPNPREIYNNKLIGKGIVEANLVKEMDKQFKQLLQSDLDEAKKNVNGAFTSFMKKEWNHIKNESESKFLLDTGVSIKKLNKIAKSIYSVPKNFNFYKKILKLMNDREKMFKEKKFLDWGMSELLAYGSLLIDGIGVRISGQDVERGTFSHRHGVLKTIDSEEKYFPLNNIDKDQAKFEIYNSLLSEYGALGFDYGYALASPNDLIIWEAQFGDFSNGAQIIIDQYLSSAEDKWKIFNGLVLLLPHGYEGQGAEHSSARLERYLQLCAQNNIQVTYPTTPSNFFHLIRRQMLRSFRKPLVIMSPKSLLRHPKCISNIKEYQKGVFQKIIDDKNVKKVKKIVFCSGKIYYDLYQEKEKRNIYDIAIIRLEQLYPFPMEDFKLLVKKYETNNIIWVQEEPANMGAWSFVNRMCNDIKFHLISRNESASPASGSYKTYFDRQVKLINEVFDY